MAGSFKEGFDAAIQKRFESSIHLAKQSVIQSLKRSFNSLLPDPNADNAWKRESFDVYVTNFAEQLETRLRVYMRRTFPDSKSILMAPLQKKKINRQVIREFFPAIEVLADDLVQMNIIPRRHKDVFRAITLSASQTFVNLVLES